MIPILWPIFALGFALLIASSQPSTERACIANPPWQGVWACDNPYGGVAPLSLARQIYIPVDEWDIRGGLPIRFALVHNSMATRNNPALGTGEWLTSYDIRLHLANGNTLATVEWAHLKQSFSLVNGVWTSADGFRDTLAPLNGSYLLTGHDQIKYTFAATTDPAVHRLASIKDQSNNSISLVYNATNGKLTQVKDQNARSVKLTYNAQTGRLSTVKYVASTYTRTWTFAYDAGGRLSKITLPTMTTDTGPQVYTILLTTDPATNNITSLTDPEVHQWQFGYSGDQAAWAQAPGNDPAHRTLYAMAGPDHTMTDPDGVVLRYRYDNQGRLTHCLDGASKETAYVYGDPDYTWAPSTVTNPVGDVTAVNYDARGNPVQITPPGDGTYDLTFNTKNRLTKVLEPTVTDADGHVENARHRTDYFYDNKSRLIKVREYTSANTFVDIQLLSWSTQGLLLTATDALGHATNYTYDAYGHMISVQTPSGRSMTASYSDVNLTCGFRVPQSTQIINGAGATYQYDEWARLRQRVQADTSDAAYSYDGLGKLVKVVDSSGTSTFHYNANAYCDQQTDGGGWTLVSTLTAAGRQVQADETYPGGQATALYAYDNLGRWVGTTDGGQATYGYDDAHRPVTTDRANGHQSVLTWSQGHCVDDADLDPLQVPAASFHFDYQSNGLLKKKTELDGSVTKYYYDFRDQLTRENRTSPEGNFDIQYAYDNAGRRIGRTTNGVQTTFTFDADSLIQTLEMFSEPDGIYSWDAAGRLASISDVNGLRQFAWDDAGRMVQATINGVVRDQYAYDGLGNRTSSDLFDAAGQLRSQSHLANANTLCNANTTISRLANGNTLCNANTIPYSRLANGNTLTGSVWYPFPGPSPMPGLRREIRTTNAGTFDLPVKAGPGGIDSFLEYDTNANAVDEYFPVTDNTGSRAVFDSGLSASGVYDSFGRTLQYTGLDLPYKSAPDDGARTGGAAGLVIGMQGCFIEPESGAVLNGIGLDNSNGTLFDDSLRPANDFTWKCGVTGIPNPAGDFGIMNLPWLNGTWLRRACNAWPEDWTMPWLTALGPIDYGPW